MELNSVGIAGEVRCVVTKADGTVKTDTGYQKNIILNQGMNFFGGGKGGSINEYCAIGSGNSVPVITQTALDAYIAQAIGTNITSSYTYTNTGDNLYRIWEQRKYRFTGLNNVNISEIGLVSTGTAPTNYYLTTRALIKDDSGAPTSISVKTGETLDIFYKFHKVIDISDKSFVINIVDGNGGSVPYNVLVRSALVGNMMYTYAGHFASPYSNSGAAGYNNSRLYTGEIGDILSLPQGSAYNGAAANVPYVAGSYKGEIRMSFGLDQANNSLRSMSLETTFGAWKMRFGRVSDDAPLIKTANDTLVVPFELSWSRFEGVL